MKRVSRAALAAAFVLIAPCAAAAQAPGTGTLTVAHGALVRSLPTGPGVRRVQLHVGNTR